MVEVYLRRVDDLPRHGGHYPDREFHLGQGVRRLRLRVPLIAAVIAAGLSLGPSPWASADDPDTQFIAEVPSFLNGRFLDPATTKALIVDAKMVCAMSDTGSSYDAMELINTRWKPSDIYGFMRAATKAYCPAHTSDWSVPQPPG
jgi:hypothetical protein